MFTKKEAEHLIKRDFFRVRLSLLNAAASLFWKADPKLTGSEGDPKLQKQVTNSNVQSFFP